MDVSINLDEKDTISQRKSLIKSTIKNIRGKLDILASKILKNKINKKEDLFR